MNIFHSLHFIRFDSNWESKDTLFDMFTQDTGIFQLGISEDRHHNFRIMMFLYDGMYKDD